MDLFAYMYLSIYVCIYVCKAHVKHIGRIFEGIEYAPVMDLSVGTLLVRDRTAGPLPALTTFYQCELSCAYELIENKSAHKVIQLTNDVSCTSTRKCTQSGTIN